MSKVNNPKKKSEQTRKSILDSARKAFRQCSYEQVGVREICASAGTGMSPALVYRYFGSKLSLFREVLLDDMDYNTELYSEPSSQLGKRLAEFLTGSVESERLLLFMRSVSCPDALPVLREALQKKITSLLKQALPPPFVHEKSALITSHIFGFIVIHRIVGTRRPDREAISEQMARSLQVLIDFGLESGDDDS